MVFVGFREMEGRVTWERNIDVLLDVSCLTILVTLFSVCPFLSLVSVIVGDTFSEGLRMSYIGPWSLLDWGPVVSGLNREPSLFG